MKKVKDKKRIKKQDQQKPEKPAPSKSTEAEENPFDFGGLPNRDLKKNMGCGCG